MKRTAIALMLGASWVAMDPALGHGGKPQHGGIVASANDLSYELVADSSGATIYIVDHDKPVDVRLMSGKLTVLNGTEKSEVDLRPVGGNRLEARPAKIGKGAKAVASLKGADGRITTVRFSVK